MSPQERSQWSKDFHASYTTKDLIQYALAVGFSSNNHDDELRYTFEENHNFEAVPTFCFVLPSWASSKPDASFSYIQPFPTPMMAHMGVIPTTCLKENTDIDSCPVIHISQSVTWHQQIPIPSTRSPDDQNSRLRTLVSGRVVSVTPKSIGTFVETETRIRLNDDGGLLCTLSATLLVLGMDASKVIPMVKKGQTARRPCKIPNTPPKLHWSFTTTPNQALLYRMVSGDFNTIHVDASSTAMMMVGSSSDKPILHGLCTLGIALRGLLRLLNQEEVTVVSLRAQFTKPVFLGDTLKLEAWVQDDQDTVVFRVLQEASSVVVLDRGELVFRSTKSAQSRSKL